MEVSVAEGVFVEGAVRDLIGEGVLERTRNGEVVSIVLEECFDSESGVANVDEHAVNPAVIRAAAIAIPKVITLFRPGLSIDITPSM
jgi:hypothetical protein